VPAKEQILAARDRLVARHPRLRVIGCHLGSMEEDIADIAERLEKYPNFAVDMAARVVHLSRQDREKVRRVILKYPDRFLYATDFVLMTWNDAGKSLKNWETELERDWKFLATAETVEMQGRKVQGLALPGDVLKKIYRENALRWAPGISNTK
jgi:predicted TIM-barrel fold metal-dependent hydrolase